MRQVTLVGTDLSVIKAEEMIQFLVANPGMDAMAGISMLLREKSSGFSWGSGPPYTTMPNNGRGIQGFGGNGNGGTGIYGGGGYGQATPTQYTGYCSTSKFGFNRETEVFLCDKVYMGRVIGQKGVTINDVQKRSGCSILINQEVPQGHDCQITIKGPRESVDNAKQMLTEIIQMGPNHPYAGGGGYPPHQCGQQLQQLAPQQQMSHEYFQSAYGQQPYPPAYGQSHPHQTGMKYTQPPGGYLQHSVSGIPGDINQESPWKAAIAPNGQTYYYNSNTGETSWQRQPGMQ